mmetsp:Transcript_15816/g.22506  ORF Transcript_15816/g.22506 Transcript_15816/m.22506 type:complete len:571 (-) Transcript_15816:198-1910(-)
MPRYALRFKRVHLGYYAIALASFLICWFFYVSSLFVRVSDTPLESYTLSSEILINSVFESIATHVDDTTKVDSPYMISFQKSKCQSHFRTYPSKRYYDVNAPLQKQPTYLSQAEYIRGVPPFVLNPPFDQPTTSFTSSPKKICLDDTSEWEDAGSRLPFSDGQNPSIVSLRFDNPLESSGPYLENRLHSETIMPLISLYGGKHIQNMYLSTLLFGDSQCKWKMSRKEIDMKMFSLLNQPPSYRTVIALLDSSLNVIEGKTLELELDATWGTSRRHKILSETVTNDPALGGKITYKRSIVQFDDPRFFFHDGAIHILYRNGPVFGYETQVQNRLHFDLVDSRTFKVYVKASESFTICCGRNIAFLPPPIPPTLTTSTFTYRANLPLQALTWVDPVTVVDVDLTPVTSERRKRRLMSRKIKSSIHGTNGYLLPIRSRDGAIEYLGIAHFHRPEGRSESSLARHGHHYTHAFYTIVPKNYTPVGTENDYQLSRISNEFVFSSPITPDVPKPNTTDIIQFASGLDFTNDGRLLISYGINDCEGAVVFTSFETVQNLLDSTINNMKEVVDLMSKI